MTPVSHGHRCPLPGTAAPAPGYKKLRVGRQLPRGVPRWCDRNGLLRARQHAGGHRGCGRRTINVHTEPSWNGDKAGERGEQLSPPPRTPRHTLTPAVLSPELQQVLWGLGGRGGESWGSPTCNSPEHATAPPEGKPTQSRVWGLSVPHGALYKEFPYTQWCCGTPRCWGGFVSPNSPGRCFSAPGDTEAGRAGTPVPVPRGHPVPRGRKGSGWVPLPAGCRRKRGRKGLAGAPQSRDGAYGTGAAAGGGTRGSPGSHSRPR